jgi:prepilin-type N-terminal cleavage/methylation domain-containing protein
MPRPRPRPTERRGSAGLGYTLIEVVVAMLISCIMVTAMFSVALTSRQGSGKSDRHLIANQAARQVSSQLRAYVTGCNCDPSTGACSTVNNDCTMMTGPNTTRAGVATWYFNSPGASPPVIDSQGDVWALKIGDHSLTGVLPSWFEGAPYNARVVYTVTVPASFGGRPQPQVYVHVDWTEP